MAETVADLREIRKEYVAQLHHAKSRKRRLWWLRHIHKLTVHIRWAEQHTFFTRFLGALSLSARAAFRGLKLLKEDL